MKGISPIVAVVLLIAIAVVAGVGLYFWLAGIATKQPTPNMAIAITAIPLGGGKILVANLGSTPLSVDDVQSNCDDIIPDYPGTEIGPSQQGGPFTLIGCHGDIVIYGARIGSANLQLASVFGTMCPSECGTGEACTDGGSCASGNCTTGVCRPDCTNTCENGDECALDDDCANSTCISGTCRPDCYPECPDGHDCVEDGDCANETCDGGVCQPISSDLFIKEYGQPVFSDEARSVDSTSDGGYVFGGVVHFDTNFTVVKLNHAGDFEWSKQYSTGIGCNEMMRAVRQTPDSGYIFVGTESCTTGAYETLAIKLFPDGTVQWANVYNTTNAGWEQPHSVEITADGGYLLVGEVQVSGVPPRTDMLALKLNPDGSAAWAKRYGYADPIQTAQHAWDAEDAPGGGYLLVGEWSNLTANRAIVLRISGVGGITWGKRYSCNTTNSFDGTSPAAVHWNGSEYGVTGYCEWVAEDYEGSFLFRVSDAGAISGVTGYYNTDGTSYLREGKSALATNGYFITGETSPGDDEGMFVLKASSSGTLEWANEYMVNADEVYVYESASTADGGQITAGSYGGNDPAYNSLATCTDSSGDVPSCTEYADITVNVSSAALPTAWSDSTAPDQLSLTVNDMPASVAVTDYVVQENLICPV